ncbi:beta-hexosaminidase [Rhodobacteraceae bacterium 2CG4]|uniref:beta-N-acetylhexosaminidase n=1 Tax=Halovulum marinum TaxID=2662447 RepID=A0A6L5Z0F4_9RHOB|nr:glycoside hydrolase family 3 N-terminal domain-containing protein [Halovulum marinum]MSU89789.1 beta-hexosaminidase [Halovulum marinum]
MSARAAILGCSGPVLTRAEARFFASSDPWGFILFARNVETPAQVRALVRDLRGAVGREAPVLIDQEGGRVARLTPPHWTGWDNAESFLARFAGPRERVAAMRLRYHVIGTELALLGIDVNCAPMVDIARPETHVAIRQRLYGAAPDAVATLGRAVADGLAAGGVLPVLKHVPGHGRTPLDSHLSLPVVDAPRDLLEAEDFAPFRALADLPLGMTAHIVYAALDAERPATTSPAVLAAIRADIGFRGALMSDDLSMGALSGTLDARAAAAIAAGCDLALHCNGDADEMRAVMGAAPRLAGAALARTDAALAARAALQPVPIDVPAALQQIDDLARGVPVA